MRKRQRRLSRKGGRLNFRLDEALASRSYRVWGRARPAEQRGHRMLGLARRRESSLSLQHSLLHPPPTCQHDAHPAVPSHQGKSTSPLSNSCFPTSALRLTGLLFYRPQPYKEEFLTVDSLHKLSIKQYGNPQGVPIVHLHGGPGGGCDDKDAQRFDPAVYRIVLFDQVSRQSELSQTQLADPPPSRRPQRGCDLSTPASCLVDNTTQHLIADIEKIREHLQVGPSWHVFGGSWGTPPRTPELAMFTTRADGEGCDRIHPLARLCAGSSGGGQESQSAGDLHSQCPLGSYCASALM